MAQLTIKQAAQLAIDSQSACNTQALVKSLDRIFDTLKHETKGTTQLNSHPIVRLFAEQIMFLASKTDYMTAHNECERLAKE